MPSNCDYWASKVDPDVPLQGARIMELPADDDAAGAIRCLLMLHGRAGRARFGGALRDDVTVNGKPTPIDVAALFFMSSIYEQSWDHAHAVEIVGPHGSNTRATVREAYEAFERWSRTVDRLGIAEVRARKLDPLAGTKLYWY
jgi:hypothetical protein